MPSSDDLLALVKRKGPVIPSNVAKEMGQNLIFTSAMLSELAARKLVRISAMKIGGGSPLYYTPEQEKDLVKFINHLDPKDQSAVNELQQKEVLRDSDCSPLLRVSLRAVKDFAVPLEVTLGGNTEIFWKWFLTQDDRASDLIHKMLGASTKQPEPVPEPDPEPTPEPRPEPDPKPEPTPEPQPQPTPEPEPSPEPEPQPEPLEKEERPKKEKVEKQETIRKKPKSKNEDGQERSEFHQKVHEYFEEKEITVYESKIIRKGREYEFLVDVPSAVGSVSFLCVAKNKKTISDGDLATLYLSAQSRKLPLLVLTEGKLSKKAEGMLSNELKGLTIAKIDGS